MEQVRECIVEQMRWVNSRSGEGMSSDVGEGTNSGIGRVLNGSAGQG